MRKHEPLPHTARLVPWRHLRGSTARRCDRRTRWREIGRQREPRSPHGVAGAVGDGRDSPDRRYSSRNRRKRRTEMEWRRFLLTTTTHVKTGDPSGSGWRKRRDASPTKTCTLIKNFERTSAAKNMPHWSGIYRERIDGWIFRRIAPCCPLVQLHPCLGSRRNEGVRLSVGRRAPSGNTAHPREPAIYPAKLHRWRKGKVSGGGLLTRE